MTDLEWKAPPETVKGRTHDREKWDPIAEALRSRPGEWALIQRDSHSAVTTSIKEGRIAAFKPNGSFDATARKVAPGKYDIYARFIDAEVSA